MNSIFKLAPRPSDAVQAMIDGLKEQATREDFAVDMGTFAGRNPEQCFGCAATCFLQKVSGINITVENAGVNCNMANSFTKRAAIYGFDEDEVHRFELVLDRLRSGEPYSLLSLYGIDQFRWPEFKLPYLNTENWRKKIQYYQRYVEILKKKGL